MPMLPLDAILNLVVPLALGASFGMERQWRQRLAGLRTNTLVSLGAGIIFREGFNVRDLNTVATLWCAAAVATLWCVAAVAMLWCVAAVAMLWCVAAVAMLAGAGEFVLAVAVTGCVVFVNLALRPLSRLLDRQPIQTAELGRACSVDVVCRGAQEAHVRALMLQGFAASGLHLSALDSENIEDADRVEVTARVHGEGIAPAALEQIVGRLSLEPAVTAAP